MGRPLGSKNGDRMVMPWRPMTWKPSYDLIVALHCAGHSNVEIAEIMEYSSVQIGNILGSPEAKKRIAIHADNVNAVAEESHKRRLDRIRSKALQRVEDVIMNDELAVNAPLRMLDASVGLLKGLGTLNGENHNVVNHNKTIVLSDAIAMKLLEGSALADQVKQLHAPAPALESKNEIVVEKKE